MKELVEADVDFIKDDEKLMSPAYSSLAERVKAIMPIVLDHEQKTGKKVMYAFNISSDDPEQMVRDHDIVAEAGGNAAVICINAVGFGGLKFLRKRSRLALHAHRAGWDILTRHPGLGMDFSVYQQFWRLLGIDQFQINGIRVEILGAGRELRPLVRGRHDPAVLAGRLRAAGGRLRPVGRPGARHLCPHRPHDRPPLPLRRRRGQPPRRPRGGCPRRAAGLGGGGGRRSARRLRARAP